MAIPLARGRSAWQSRVMRNAVRVLVMPIVALVACGGDDPPPVDGGAHDGGSGALEALADGWCPQEAARFCAAAEACGCEAIPEFGARAACLSRAERGCRDRLASFASAVAAGALEVAPAVPDGCAAAYEAALARCHLPEPDLFAVACPLVWPRGASRDLPGSGAMCFEGLCAPDARCGDEGRCAVPVSGGACTIHEACPAGERCGDAGTCRPLLLEGNGASCGGPSDCAGDLLCLASSRRECQPKVAGGECTGDEACVEGEYCGADGRCVAAPTAGQPCGNGVACAEGLACRFSGEDEGTCQPEPGEGEPCALGTFGPVVCAPGLACLDCTEPPCRDRRCGPPPGDGQPCAAGDVRCAEGLACHVEGEASVCRPPVAAGESCGLDESCATGLYCDFREGRCAPWFAPGTTCRDGNECGDGGACVPDDAGAFRCVPRPTRGEACFLDTCAPGLVCRSPHEAGACAPPMCAAHRF